MKRTSVRIALAVAVLFAALGALVVALNVRDEPALDGAAAVPPTSAPAAEQVQRGAYLARAGNCAACHTARGRAPYAGGRGIETPFGTLYASNLTPDAKTGLGGWSAAHFWRAMHNGRSKDGRLLYPAFPYPNYTQVTRDDSDALHAFLRSLPPMEQANRPHALRFPYGFQASLAVWRALFFEPGAFQPDATKSAEWNRGAYLVRGLGHCNACHASRNLFGATGGSLELGGGLIPMQNWYAPSLASSREAGVADWAVDDIVALLQAGTSPRGSVMGPMAEVVYGSTQHLADADLRAMAAFLKTLPQREAAPLKREAPGPALAERGGELYARHCAECHGDRGEGAAGAYPPLAGNRAVTMDPPANVVRIVLNGGFLPATARNPRPYGMPPFVHVLGDADVAAVTSFIRGSWGNAAGEVTVQEVQRYR